MNKLSKQKMYLVAKFLFPYPDFLLSHSRRILKEIHWQKERTPKDFFPCSLSLILETCILEVDLKLPLDLLRYMNFWHGKTFSRLKKNHVISVKDFKRELMFARVPSELGKLKSCRAGSVVCSPLLIQHI